MRDKAILAAVLGAVIAGAFTVWAALLSRTNDGPAAPSQPVPTHPGTATGTAAVVTSPAFSDGWSANDSPTSPANSEITVEPEQTNGSEKRLALDRTAVFFEPAPDLGRPAELIIGFRNSSQSVLHFRVHSVHLTIDGAPFRLPEPPDQWFRLEPTEDGGPLISVPNRGLIMQVGTVIEIRYEIDIRASPVGRFERRYDVVELVVTSFTPTLRTQLRERASRSTFLEQ